MSIIFLGDDMLLGSIANRYLNHAIVMHKLLYILIFILTLYSLSVSAVPSSAWQDTIGEGDVRKDMYHQFDSYFNKSYVGFSLIIGGLLVKPLDHKFQVLRNDFVPHFKCGYDDYTQYLPIAATLGLKALGVKGRSSWGRMLVSDVFAVVMMSTAVGTLKQSTRTMRPDGSKRNSFPSGHTANAFMGATILHKEYGTTVSPWISVGAYTVATATAIGRQLNNHHWLSDVMVGAGIGILSAEVGYLLGDLIFKQRGLLKERLPEDFISLDSRPSFLGYYLGSSHIGSFVSLSEPIRIKTSPGVTAGVEGAYFFNPYWGIGGKFNASNATISAQGLSMGVVDSATTNDPGSTVFSEPIDVVSIAAGAYASYPLTKRFRIGTKTLLGYTNASKVSLADNVQITPFQTFYLETGCSFSILLSKRFAIRPFYDLSLIPNVKDVLIEDGQQSTRLKGKSMLLNSVFAISANIFF